MTWSRIKKLADDFLPQARILHPWPHARFAVKHPRWEPSALIGHARICAGGDPAANRKIAVGATSAPRRRSRDLQPLEAVRRGETKRILI